LHGCLGVVTEGVILAAGREKPKYGLYDWKDAIAQIPIWMSQVGCRGDEVMLEHCVHKRKDFVWGENHCEHNNDVAVCCVPFN
jgi:hypothetical protein